MTVKIVLIFHSNICVKLEDSFYIYTAKWYEINKK